MFNHQIVLLTEKTFATDAFGNPNREYIRTTHLCEEKEIARSEFYNAARAGLKPEIIVSMSAWEYDGQSRCEYGGSEFFITRSYKSDRDTVELTLSKKAGA